MWIGGSILLLLLAIERCRLFICSAHFSLWVSIVTEFSCLEFRTTITMCHFGYWMGLVYLTVTVLKIVLPLFICLIFLPILEKNQRIMFLKVNLDYWKYKSLYKNTKIKIYKRNSCISDRNCLVFFLYKTEESRWLLQDIHCQRLIALPMHWNLVS